jgi:hypothetical protein
MAEMHHHSTPPGHGHETRDISIRGVALFGLSLAVLLAGSLGLMAWLLDIFDVAPEGHGPRGAPLAAAPPRLPGPQLQTSPTRDMQEMVRAENARLQSYAWVDRDAGIARIPIDRAMELVVQQGLPTWHEVSGLPTDERVPAQQEGR